VEMVRTNMPATLDGAILAKMADRRQIVDGIVDGPLDLDAAVDAEAARIKHISSPVAGIADVLIVPNIEAGNMVYKNLAFMADAQTAGLVVGARVPVMLASRAGSDRERSKRRQNAGRRRLVSFKDFYRAEMASTPIRCLWDRRTPDQRTPGPKSLCRAPGGSASIRQTEASAAPTSFRSLSRATFGERRRSPDPTRETPTLSRARRWRSS